MAPVEHCQQFLYHFFLHDAGSRAEVWAFFIEIVCEVLASGGNADEEACEGKARVGVWIRG